MTVKSLEDLKKIREEALGKMKLRNQSGEEGKTEILIGMATCGIASGARQTMNAMLDEIGKLKLDNVKVVQVGCIGYCHSEPCVQVNMPGKESVIYGKINDEKGRQIVQHHIKEGNVIDKYILDTDFERA